MTIVSAAACTTRRASSLAPEAMMRQKTQDDPVSCGDAVQGVGAGGDLRVAGPRYRGHVARTPSGPELFEAHVPRARSAGLWAGPLRDLDRGAAPRTPRAARRAPAARRHGRSPRPFPSATSSSPDDEDVGDALQLRPGGCERSTVRTPRPRRRARRRPRAARRPGARTRRGRPDRQHARPAPATSQVGNAPA